MLKKLTTLETETISICHARLRFGLSCNGCIHKGKDCETIKTRLKVEHPRDGVSENIISLGEEVYIESD